VNCAASLIPVKYVLIGDHYIISHYIPHFVQCELDNALKYSIERSVSGVGLKPERKFIFCYITPSSI